MPLMFAVAIPGFASAANISGILISALPLLLLATGQSTARPSRSSGRKLARPAATTSKASGDARLVQPRGTV
jgi:hypothetical protein